MGSSSTNGCGGSETPHRERCSAGGNASHVSRFCDLSRSWVRYMHDALQSLHLPSAWPGGANLTTHVSPRNAVGAWYFARCTNRFVPRGTHAVVLELAQVGSLSDLADSLPALVASIRRATPHVAIVLLMWLSQFVMYEQTPHEVQERVTHRADHEFNRSSGAKTTPLATLINVGLALGVDIIRIDRIAFSLATHPDLVHRGRRETQACPPSVVQGGSLTIAPHWLFAQLGKDLVHPTPEVHLLIGRLVAQSIADRLAGREAESVPVPVGRDVTREEALDLADDDAEGGGGAPLRRIGVADSRSSGTERAPFFARRGAASVRPANRSDALVWEQCFGAEDLPVVGGTPPWGLVDEGPSDKGTRKQGYLSRSIGDSLLIGPVGRELQNEGMQHAAIRRRTGWAPVITIEVGYLLARNAEFGALTISCENCTCKREVSTFVKSLHPFPHVDTCSLFSANVHYRDAGFNSTITASTAFTCIIDLPPLGSGRAPKPCMIRVTHRPAGTGLSPSFRQRACQPRDGSPRAYWCTPSNHSRVRFDTLNAYMVFNEQNEAYSESLKLSHTLYSH